MQETISGSMVMPLGGRPVTYRFLSRGKRVNAIGTMSQDGMIALELVSGPVCGKTFFDFVRSTLIPVMTSMVSIHDQFW